MFVLETQFYAYYQLVGMSSAKRYLFTGSKADDSAVHKAVTKGITGKCCCDTPNVNNMTEPGRYTADGMSRRVRSVPGDDPTDTSAPPANTSSSGDLSVVPDEPFVQWMTKVPYYVSVPMIAVGGGIVYMVEEFPGRVAGMAMAIAGTGMMGARMISRAQDK